MGRREGYENNFPVGETDGETENVNVPVRTAERVRARFGRALTRFIKNADDFRRFFYDWSSLSTACAWIEPTRY